MAVHTLESLAQKYNSEVVVPPIWQPPRFERADWMWIKSIAQSGPDQDDQIQNVKVGSGEAARRLTCMHRTQPRRNFAVFYRRLAFDMVLVIGIGSHNASNKQYTVQWADGCKNRISLAAKKETGPFYLVNPIGGLFAFETLDALLNQECLSLPMRIQ